MKHNYDKNSAMIAVLVLLLGLLISSILIGLVKIDTTIDFGNLIVGFATIVMAIVTIYMASTSQKSFEVLLKNERKEKIQDIYDNVVENLRKEFLSFRNQIGNNQFFHIPITSRNLDDIAGFHIELTLKKGITKSYYTNPKIRIAFENELIIPKKFSESIYSKLTEYDAEVENLQILMDFKYSIIPKTFIDEANKIEDISPIVLNEKTGKIWKERIFQFYTYVICDIENLNIKNFQNIFGDSSMKFEQINPCIMAVKNDPDSYYLILKIKMQKAKLISISDDLDKILNELSQFWFENYLIDLHIGV